MSVASQDRGGKRSESEKPTLKKRAKTGEMPRMAFRVTRYERMSRSELTDM